jgi:uncharacterized membrane protein
MQYLVLKAAHVLSVVLFLGNIITGVFWKYHGDRSADLRARVQALDGIIASDRWFTLPGVAAIIVTGVWLATLAHLPILATGWLLWALILFGVSGIAFQFCVAPLQRKMLANVRAGVAGNWNESEYRSLSNAWKWWGSVATLAPLGSLFLMVTKPLV